MDSRIHSNGSYNPTSGNDPSRPVPPPHLQQNPASTSAPLIVQQGYRTPYMFPLPPPPSSSVAQAPLTTMLDTTQSYTHSSYLYPTSQLNSQQWTSPSPSSQTYRPPSMVLPPPPPLPPGTTPRGQVLYRPSYSMPSLPLSIPFGNSESPGGFLPPPPPPSSSSLVPVLAAGKSEAGKHVGEASAFSGQVPDHKGKSCSKVDPAVGDDGSAKGSSACHEYSSPPEKAEVGSPLCANSDTEMEDDITQPEDDLQYVSAEINSTMGPSRNLQTGPFPGDNTLSSNVQLGQEKDSDGSRQASSSPYSGRADNVRESGSGDMYDPFFDSIEPLPNVSKTPTSFQEHELASDSGIMPKLNISSNGPPDIVENNKGNDTQRRCDSDMMPRPSLSSCKPPVIEENTRGNDIGAVITGKSEEDEEFGENADGEAGGVSLDTDSPDSPDEVADSNTKVGADENPAGKKSMEKTTDKEPRSTRHFKVVLTQFVKDLLKPSWRQGNMSKEAFKTIVKKTVEKVLRSMEGRRIPKSRAKIERYIDSSRHKLTKLVTGYVNKYVKA
ncbi:PREDICTED: flocculation protein FLO11 isoform X2 [Tarenaya hassleriana]|uniref:flocculation protein FLO11 isoform X2 n=1 Tax=Tarenaya hassleriana TaxID=28532 RepID=UPI00053C4652|nr:PREDICTED: flocculation protein FLO11 isoform X2 [Tarenaya hassleriana]